MFAPLYAEAKQQAAGQDPYAARPNESPEMVAHRARMGTDEGKSKYRERAKIAEFPNADYRNRGLTQFRVRGLVKAKAQTLWHVLAVIGRFKTSHGWALQNQPGDLGLFIVSEVVFTTIVLA